MSQEKTSQMSAVTLAIFLKEYRNIGSILSEETALRTKLARLDAKIAQNKDAEFDNHLIRAVGADLLWQSWTSRTRRQLNIELAQILARKSAVMDRVRIAFGRQQAVESLRNKEQSDRRKRITKHFRNSVILQ